MIEVLLKEKKIIIDNNSFDGHNFSFDEYRKFCDLIEKSENMVSDIDDNDFYVWETEINGIRIRDSLDKLSALTILEILP
jgi:hypothetical protein